MLRSPGRPLAAPLREEMEARLGAQFSDVRVHADTAARAAAAEVGARAYTSGSHVVIGDGGTDKHTLAHELTHVIQQRQGPVAGTDHGSGFQVSDPFDIHEQAAEANAIRVMRASPGQHRAAGLAAATAPVAPLAAPAVPRSGPIRVQRTIPRDTPPGTRVIYIKNTNSFYLSVGTVLKGQPVNGKIGVKFDIKPAYEYDIPLDDLDHYNEKAATRFYPLAPYDSTAKQHQTYKITGLPSLARFMSEHEKKLGPWALTGSAALQLWTQYYGKKFPRKPKDVDVLVENLHQWYFNVKLAVEGEPGEAGPQDDNKTVEQGNFKLDLLQDGSRFGKLNNGIVTLFGVKVVSIKTLEGQIKERLDNYDEWAEEKPKNEIGKDLKFIYELLPPQTRKK